ncbi:MAG: hypothetical protein HY017_27595 [Betaproteobacteria bacterium]|nr:hypothetical protein [Betaproteobacteria bacterium]
MDCFAMKKSVSAAVCLALAAGCASPGGPQGVNDNSSSAECSPGIAMGVGALIGGLLSSGSNRARGAAAGAAIGALACLAFNYSSKQVKSAQQVQQEYKAAQGSEPERTTVTKYENSYQPGTVVQSGKPMQVSSYIEVVQGRDNVRPTVEEELVLYHPDGREATKTRKTANAGQGAGGYSTTFSLTLPAGIPQGQYPLKTAVYLNGTKALDRNATLQVVMTRDGAVTASVVAREAIDSNWGPFRAIVHPRGMG